MRIKQKKISKKRISTHMSLLILVIVIFILITSFVIYSNSRVSKQPSSSSEISSSSNGDILDEAASTFKSSSKDSTSSSKVPDDSTNIMNTKPIVNNKFVALKGDGLAIITRGYIKEYISKNNLELTKVQRMYIEGIYINNRNYPLLNVGQNVVIDEQEIISLIDKSQSLSPKVEAIWAIYAKKIF